MSLFIATGVHLPIIDNCSYDLLRQVVNAETFITDKLHRVTYIDASAGLHSDRPASGEVRLVPDPSRQ